jgi:hypothetical protein
MATVLLVRGWKMWAVLWKDYMSDQITRSVLSAASIGWGG